MGVKNGLPAQEHLLVIPLVELKNAYFQKRPGPLWGSDVINPRSWTECGACANPVRLQCDCHYEIASPHSWNSNAKALCAPTAGQEERRFAARHGIGAAAGQCKFATPA